jgi:hypothetical protein
MGEPIMAKVDLKDATEIPEEQPFKFFTCFKLGSLQGYAFKGKPRLGYYLFKAKDIELLVKESMQIGQKSGFQAGFKEGAAEVVKKSLQDLFKDFKPPKGATIETVNVNIPSTVSGNFATTTDVLSATSTTDIGAPYMPNGIVPRKQIKKQQHKKLRSR